MAPAATVLPDPTRLHLVRLMASDVCITAVVETMRPAAMCPLCGCASTRVHSRSVRRVADLPWHGVAFRLLLHVRRCFCDQFGCARRVFTERLPGLVAPHARRTERLTLWLRAVGFAVGGEAGARLLRSLGLVTSPDTLMREIRQTPLPVLPVPEVVSVDDWCLRRGQRYGAILVDLARRQVVDLLPDREADTFVSWLKARPPVAVVSRDRGANFAEGAARAAPQAVQVADRFHVLKNWVEALQQVLGREQASLQAAAHAAQRSGGTSGTGDGLVFGHGVTPPHANAPELTRRRGASSASRRVGGCKPPASVCARSSPNGIWAPIPCVASCGPSPVPSGRLVRLVRPGLPPVSRSCATAGMPASRTAGTCSPKSGGAAIAAAAPICLRSWPCGALGPVGRVPTPASRASRRLRLLPRAARPVQ